jgi:hypothetical protein
VLLKEGAPADQRLAAVSICEALNWRQNSPETSVATAPNDEQQVRRVRHKMGELLVLVEKLRGRLAKIRDLEKGPGDGNSVPTKGSGNPEQDAMTEPTSRNIAASPDDPLAVDSFNSALLDKMTRLAEMPSQAALKSSSTITFWFVARTIERYDDAYVEDGTEAVLSHSDGCDTIVGEGIRGLRCISGSQLMAHLLDDPSPVVRRMAAETACSTLGIDAAVLSGPDEQVSMAVGDIRPCLLEIGGMIGARSLTPRN